jgi:NitT/TauT family transport system ATP-binding protein
MTPPTTSEVSEQAAVQLEDVGVVYQTSQGAMPALSGVSLSVASAEFVSLIGASGCGKSTLLAIVADMIAPASGRVTVCGQSAHQARLDHRYSFVFQEPVLLPWSTVRSNVGLPLELAHVAPEQRRKRVDELLRIVKLEEFGDRFPRELSGGMRMRASLARALTQNPSILLMDEPFGALDEITRVQMNRELLRVWEATSAAVMFVTHSIEEAVLLSDRVIVLSPRPGRIVATIDINLERPRDHATLVNQNEFIDYTRQVRRALHEA